MPGPLSFSFDVSGDGRSGEKIRWPCPIRSLFFKAARDSPVRSITFHVGTATLPTSAQSALSTNVKTLQNRETNWKSPGFSSKSILNFKNVGDDRVRSGKDFADKGTARFDLHYILPGMVRCPIRDR